MDINIISEKTAFSMTKEHIRALNALLESAQTYHINGADVVLAEATLDSIWTIFAFLAHKMMEMEKFDILFAIGRMDDRIQIVARSRSHAVNVGAVCSAFGGGGHAYAASASVRDKTLSEVRGRILTQLYLQEEGEDGQGLHVPARHRHRGGTHHRRGGRTHAPFRAQDHARLRSPDPALHWPHRQPDHPEGHLPRPCRRPAHGLHAPQS